MDFLHQLIALNGPLADFMHLHKLHMMLGGFIAFRFFCFWNDPRTNKIWVVIALLFCVITEKNLPLNGFFLVGGFTLLSIIYLRTYSEQLLLYVCSGLLFCGAIMGYHSFQPFLLEWFHSLKLF